MFNSFACRIFINVLSSYQLCGTHSPTLLFLFSFYIKRCLPNPFNSLCVPPSLSFSPGLLLHLYCFSHFTIVIFLSLLPFFSGSFSTFLILLPYVSFLSFFSPSCLSRSLFFLNSLICLPCSFLYTPHVNVLSCDALILFFFHHFITLSTLLKCFHKTIKRIKQSFLL